MPFIKNLWYVAAWSHELNAEGPIGRTIIGEPIVLYRKPGGAVVALEDRCPHRHAPLSLGRIEGEGIRCMYHGLTLGPDGVCTGIPGGIAIPPGTAARRFPVVERWSWIWVWMGNPANADPAQIPDAYGLDDPDWAMRSDALDYAADYQLIHDNLCDLSHLDFAHETTLGASTGSKWSNEQPKLTPLADGLLFERWFLNHLPSPGNPARVDTWSSYRFVLPGMFLMLTQTFPVGSAAASDFGAPSIEPIFRRREQQVVTPIDAGRSRYLYASGVEAAIATPKFLDGLFTVINAAFAEDKCIIEGQQRIWDRTPPERQKTFIVQDKGPFQFRRLIARRLAREQTDIESPTT